MALFAITVPWCRPQTSKRSNAAEPAAITSFRLVQEKDGPAVEILSTKPLTPAIQLVEKPPRLVIDLPGTIFDTPHRKFRIQGNQIRALRGDQFQASPPVARIVVDLEAPRRYTWDAAGNRLVVHLGRNPSAPSETPFQPPKVPSHTPAPSPVAASVGTGGAPAIAQNSLSPGAAVTATDETSVLALTRGGKVHVCPHTSVTVTPSQNGHNVMLGMNRGGLETHFVLDASSDSILTPDFRILFPGPGTFHFAVSADSQGNTCVRALPGNTASVIVSELIGDHTYQVKAADQVVFRLGRLDQADTAIPRDCGCPVPRQSTLPSNSVPVVNETERPSPNPEIPRNGSAAPSAPPPDAQSNELHVQVSAPLVFRAAAPPPPVEEVRALPADSRRWSVPALGAPLPPELRAGPPPEKTQSARAAPPQHTFSRKLRGFFAAIFR